MSRVYGLTESFVQEQFEQNQISRSQVLRPVRSSVWSSLSCSPSQVFPVLAWGPKLCAKDLPSALLQDMLCGLTVASIVVPQGVAYGALAGVPPIYGLYTAVVPPLIYTLTGTCMHLAIGPFALIAILTAEGVHAAVPDAETNFADAIMAAQMLSLLVGLMLLGAGILRLGFIATFLSDPVRIGYTTAVSIVIPTTQLKWAFQVEVPRGTFFETMWHIALQVQDKGVVWEALAIFFMSFGSIYAIQRLNGSGAIACLKKIPLPAELIVVILSTVLVALLGLDGRVSTLGELPIGLPSLGAPDFGRFSLANLLPSALIIAIMTYITAMSVSKTFGRRFHYEVDNNQELVSLGLSNIAGAFSSCFPAAASLSRTAVTGQVGAASPLHGVFTVVMLVGVLLFAGPLLKTLPMAGLAAIVVMAFKSLLLGGYQELQDAYRVSNSDFLLFNIAFWSTLIMGVTNGIAIAVICNIMFLLWQSTHPAFMVLGRMKGQQDFFRDRTRYTEAMAVPGVLIFKFGSPLHFANREVFATGLWNALLAQDREAYSMEDLEDLAEEREGKVKLVVVDLSQVSHIDMSGARTVEKLRETLVHRDTKLVFADTQPAVYQMLSDMGLFQFQDANYDVVCFVRLADAVRYAEGELNGGPALGGNRSAAHSKVTLTSVAPSAVSVELSEQGEAIPVPP